MILRFGRFELDRRRQELRRGGVLLRLRPQPFRLLEMLVLRGGDVVTREEIQAALWGGETFVDFEQGINSAIRQIRHVLGDHAEAPIYVQTLPRRGYRFVAVVERVMPAEPPAIVRPPEPAPAPPPAPLPPRPNRFRLASAAAAVAASLFLGPAVPRVPAPLLVTVSPFRALSGLPADAAAITAETTATLARLKPSRLRVGPRGSIIIEGTVQRTPASMRVIVTAVDRGTKARLWSETWDRPLDHAEGMQIAVAHGVAVAVAKRHLPAGRHEPLVRSRVSRQALSLYLEARRERMASGPTAMRHAEALLRRCVREEPRFAEAWSALADVRTETLIHRPPELPAATAPEVFALAERALALQPDLAEAHSARGIIRFQHDFDLAAAESEFRRAIAADREYVDAHANLSLVLCAMGRHNEAMAEWNVARDLDPLLFDVTEMQGLLLMRAGRNEDALAAFRETEAVRPADLVALWGALTIYVRERRWNEAARTVRAIAAVTDDTPVHDRESFRAVVARLLDPLRATRAGHYRMALLDAQLGDTERALEALEHAAAERVPLLCYARVDPALDPLRSDPRFNRLLARLGI